ncbi:hypothetical protein [Streptomyces sp. NBC_00151]|uniref:hypothetical protein n=1 Tax=Streptomyces sp. NBC_00151 TaxID=2975669 RepID=UPI002DDC7A5A|nr:hypothetical protein [Streptomyces sp. NBC_00151]WRZ45552.1 hypothetical protein OG915_01290 [Streptomyces sp. NBC_00151]WRZ45579.1 hypothetical protein OG915_46270 [Streptomyces sp. NBC_00151]
MVAADGRARGAGGLLADLLDAVTSAGLTAVGVGPGETSKVRRQRDRRQTSGRAAAWAFSPPNSLSCGSPT